MTDPGYGQAPDLVAENDRLRAALAAAERGRAQAEAEARAARAALAEAGRPGDPLARPGLLVDPRLRTALSIETVGAIVFDMDGQVLEANDTFLAMSGYGRQDLARGLLSGATLVPPEWQAVSRAVIAEIQAQGRSDPTEREYLRRDGSRFWGLCAATRLDDGNGFEVIIDITGRRQAEEALRRSEARYRTLFEAIDAGFCVIALRFSADGRAEDYCFLEVNPAFARHTGLADAAGRWMSDLAPGLEQHWYDLYGRVATTGESIRFVQPARALGERWFEVHAFRVDPPEAHHVAVLFNDISARRRLEDALRALNETLERQVAARTAERDRIWQVSRDMLGVADADGVWLSVNPAWTATLGWQPEEVVGRTSAWLEHPEDQDRTRDEIRRLGAGEPTLSFENRFRTRDGGYRTLSWRAVPFEGNLYCVARDVTESRERAHRLVQAEEALRQSQKMEAVGQLTGGVAHDFNNLLTIIRSSVDFLRRPDLPEARKARYLDAVSDTVDRAAKLTGQLLAFARRQALAPEVFDVVARLQGVADMLDTVTGARIRVVTQAPDRPCFVRADLSQFETALINMAVNARDAMEGEGTLTLAVACGAEKPEIRGHAAAHGPFAAISLTDTGNGMIPAVMEKIFEPFFTTKEVGKGTGLGLSQVFGFAKQSGGDVDVTSRPGAGSTFVLYLPEVAAPAEPGRPLPADEGMAPARAGQRVLLVEDNVGVGRFAAQILNDLGYVTTWVTNAEAALDVLAQDPAYDAVFSDVVMPGMGGIELGKALRQRHPGLPVLLTSGYSHVLAQEGSHGFPLLHKPYSAEQLSRMLASAIGQRRLARAPGG
ncbi:hybrid sensor histidine kinase/response regulator [Methylobacterium nonmethylotrophicum]|uniref:histidine kinase n=1 Tax=Methylobacterium nonmethylotrophicum TaxID=1141884 RepID=A0A4Z0NHA9_9HYPH|nr:PAS domain S-box protein [Methylobacterium nonmethylotrophicum]TGD94819.1 PAS domain S-box protein [Methylobacterium nonmethylotrophicum]